MRLCSIHSNVLLVSLMLLKRLPCICFQTMELIAIIFMCLQSIGEAHLKSPSPKLARPMPIGHWAGSGKLGQIRACNGRPFLAGFRIGRAWAVMGPMGLGSGAQSSYMTLKFDIFKQFLA